MRHVKETREVPYSTEQMFKLVNNIESYPAFLPWCSNAAISSESESQIIATVAMSKGLLKHKFTTKNTIKPYEYIQMELVDGPFSHLEGDWTFKELGNGKCEIALDLEFSFVTGFFSAMLDPIFHSITVKMIEAFEKRAEQIYGL